MSKKLILFEEEKLYFKNKFYILMDILISNQSNSKFEALLLMGIFYSQIISSFFSEHLDILDPQNAKSDSLLNYIEKIVRVKDLFQNNYTYFQILQVILFTIIIILIIHFIMSVILITKTSFYSYNNKVINYYIKLYFYVGYNIIYDICFSSFCFNSDEMNPNFSDSKCSSQNIITIIVTTTK